MRKPTTEQIRLKTYRCSRCGAETQIETNHYGQCYSLGTYHVCPRCPPFTRPTTWICCEPCPPHMEPPADWKIVKLGDLCEVKITKPEKPA